MIADSSSGVAAVKEAFLCPRRAPLASHSRLGAYGGGWVAAEPPQPLSSDPPGTLGASMPAGEHARLPRTVLTVRGPLAAASLS